MNGASDLQTMSWMCMSIGLLVSATSGALFVQYGEARFAFYLYAFLGLLVTVQAYYMSKNLEKITEDESLI